MQEPFWHKVTRDPRFWALCILTAMAVGVWLPYWWWNG